jgi:hypothetical protein
MAHVQGNDDGAGFGVEGTSQNNTGIIGSSTAGKGLIATSETNIGAFAWSKNSVGLTAYTGQKPLPILGVPFPPKPPRETAVYGVNFLGQAAGVIGESEEAGCYGVLGTSYNGTGVFGTSTNGEGVHGETNATNVSAIAGFELNPNSNAAAVYGEQRGSGAGLFGVAKGSGPGVFATSANGEGVHGETNATNVSAVAGFELNPNSNAAAVYGEQRGSGAGLFGVAKGSGPGVFATSASGPAGYFQGNITVSGTVTADDHVCAGGDCAEDFDVVASEQIEAGTVMVIDADGYLKESREAYDKRVAGVVSGGGDYKPGILLDKKPSVTNRLPVALVGKVYCKVDARCTPIEVGDLLTTSATAGHAMKALEPLHAFGAVIGKALRPLKAGRGLIPILVALQ